MNKREGLIDVEAQRILRRVSKNEDNVSVYERSQPTLLVRSPSMSTSVTLPSLDNLRRTEVKFGVQKVCMYIYLYVCMYVCAYLYVSIDVYI